MSGRGRAGGRAGALALRQAHEDELGRRAGGAGLGEGPRKRRVVCYAQVIVGVLDHVAHEVLAQVLGGILHTLDGLAEGQPVVLCRGAGAGRAAGRKQA